MHSDLLPEVVTQSYSIIHLESEIDRHWHGGSWGVFWWGGESA